MDYSVTQYQHALCNSKAVKLQNSRQFDFFFLEDFKQYNV